MARWSFLTGTGRDQETQSFAHGKWVSPRVARRYAQQQINKAETKAARRAARRAARNG